MTNVIRCKECAHFKLKDAPQGTCEASGLPTLAWCGCTYDFALRPEEK